MRKWMKRKRRRWWRWRRTDQLLLAEHGAVGADEGELAEAVVGYVHTFVVHLAEGLLGRVVGGGGWQVEEVQRWDGGSEQQEGHGSEHGVV